MTVAYPDTEMPSPIGSVIEVTPPPRGSVSGGSSKDERKRTHVCPTCQRAFGRLEHLTRHERSHTREKPFECFECSRRFARSDLLLRHRQKIHDRDKTSKQPRRSRAQSTSTRNTEHVTNVGKTESSPRAKRRRDSISVAPLPPRNLSVSSAQSNQTFIPASAPATTNNFFNFNYPSPSSTSPSSTTELMDSINTNYVNPADLFSVNAFANVHSLPTPASTTSASSMIPPTPPVTSYLPPYPGSKNVNSIHRGSIDSSVFDITNMMNTLSESQDTQVPQMADTPMMMDTSDTTFSPPQLFDMTSPASFDSGMHSTHANTPYQFSWQPTTRSHGNDEYNTGLPFEPSHSSVSPMDIIMKQGTKLPASNPFSVGAMSNPQLFAIFPDSNDVTDFLIDDKEPSSYTRKEPVDAMLRSHLMATIELLPGVIAPQVPPAADLSTYISAYWEFIHPHVPVFFKPGFVPQFAQEAIVLGMCALGALTMNSTQDAVALHTWAREVVKERRSHGYCDLPDVQGLFLSELFELYHRSNLRADSGNGIEELVSCARAAGLCFELENPFSDLMSFDPDTEWRTWGNNEERKRTMFAIYILTTLLHSIMNDALTGPNALLLPSDINLTLPCDEDIYAAPSPAAWKTLNLTGTEMPLFNEAFQTLLHPFSSEDALSSTQKATETLSSGRFSMFGALVLIAAANSEIHRHIKSSSDDIVEKNTSLIEKFEPALKAWEFAWRSHPHACLSASNSSFGPLPADSVPLLNLAYVRLFADTSRALGINQTIGDVFPFLSMETGGMLNVPHRIRVLKAVGYAINSLYLSEWFVGILGQSSSASNTSSPPKRNWSFVAPFAGLESAVVVGTWLDKLVQLKCPVREPEMKFLGRMDRVFPNMGMKRCGSEGRKTVDVWGVLSDEEVIRALPLSAQAAEDIRQKAEKWQSFFQNKNR